MADAAGDIASVTRRVLSVEPGRTPDVVDDRNAPGLQDSIMDMKRHSYAHLANGRVMKSADSLLESLLNPTQDREK